MKVSIKYLGKNTFEGWFSEKGKITIASNLDENLVPTPIQLVLLAVGSCSAIDVISILHKKRQEVSDYRIEVEGERYSEHPRALKKIHVHHVVTGRNISEKAVSDAIALSDRKYCSVAATLRPTAQITTSFEIINQALLRDNQSRFT